MILHNITFIIEEDINDEWLAVINRDFIPSIEKSDLVVSNRSLKLIGSPNEGITYCIQFIIENIDNYQKLQASFIPSALNLLTAKFNNRFVSFGSLMEFID